MVMEPVRWVIFNRGAVGVSVAPPPPCIAFTPTLLGLTARCVLQAVQHGMTKIMLTCFQANTAALAMYRKLGYVVDPSSPDPEVDGPETAGYVPRCLATHVCLNVSLDSHTIN